MAVESLIELVTTGARSTTANGRAGYWYEDTFEDDIDVEQISLSGITGNQTIQIHIPSLLEENCDDDLLSEGDSNSAEVDNIIEEMRQQIIESSNLPELRLDNTMAAASRPRDEGTLLARLSRQISASSAAEFYNRELELMLNQFDSEDGIELNSSTAPELHRTPMHTRLVRELSETEKEDWEDAETDEDTRRSTERQIFAGQMRQWNLAFTTSADIDDDDDDYEDEELDLYAPEESEVDENEDFVYQRRINTSGMEWFRNFTRTTLVDANGDPCTLESNTYPVNWNKGDMENLNENGEQKENDEILEELFASRKMRGMPHIKKEPLFSVDR